MNETVAFPQAAAASTVPRRDLYGPIHKAIRHFMADTLVRVGSMDAADSADMHTTLNQLSGLLALLRGHLQHENRFVHPAIEARSQGGARRIAGEHDDHVASIDALQAEADALAARPADRRGPSAMRLYRHLALFIAENLQHMDFEETAHNAVLWAAYSDAELQDMHAAIMAHVPPQEMGVVLHWMAPALSHAELAQMLGGMQAEMPPENLRAVLDQVKLRLSAARWGKLAAALGVPQQPGLVDFRA
jgi:hypothetical protein